MVFSPTLSKILIFSILVQKTVQHLDFCSQSEKNLHLQAPACTCVFLHTTKNPFYYSQNKFLKTSLYKLSILKLGKNATFGSCRVCFPFTHCQKSLIFFFLVQKTLQHLALCSRSEKPHTFRLLPVRVFFCALLKICLLQSV